MELHPAYPFFSIMIFLSFVASLVPWAWIKRDNIGILFLSLWLAMACLNQFVNSIIWYGNTRNSVPVWCDISSRLIVGLAVAIPGSIMCMVRRLYHVCSMKTFLLTPTQAIILALIEDLSICLGIPILQMDLEYIVEVNRYNIIEDIGCYPAPYNTWLAYVLSYSWPVILGAVTAVYSGMQHRFHANFLIIIHLSSQRKHYLRLVILALLEITFATPFAVVVMVFDLTIFPVLPYISWENIHSNYSVVNEVPAVLWHSDLRIAVLTEMTQWILVLCAVTFFGVFGFSGEAMNAYKTGFWTVVGLLGIKKPEMPQEDLPR
ncbi:STE3-like pheromone receptor [Rickenella mellea]|uniref:STE3-like pheromone receptor n=1 Tax=Rickenella mellea TaxID=50990 RepID=A0A4Y7PIL0_9AGAM|nr:STE3-like pheromone receptor [Rickenella mellea]